MKFKKGHCYLLNFDIDFDYELGEGKTAEKHFLVVNNVRFEVKYVYSGWPPKDELVNRTIMVISDVKTIHDKNYHVFYLYFMVVGESQIYKLHIRTDDRRIYDYQPEPCLT